MQKLAKQSQINLMKKKGVVGTGVGEKWVAGKPTGQPAVLVFVQRKFSQRGIISKFSAKDMVPDEIDGIPTDVMEVGIIKKQAGFKTKVRPLKPGYSVGHKDITAGTIGGIFIDRDGDTVILSNNHVLANENAAQPGDIIYQPGPTDSRANKRFRNWPNPVSQLPYIGTLKKYVKLKKTGNVQDSAIAKIHQKLIDDGLVNDSYPTINKQLHGFGEAKVGDNVQKCGRTTGYTTGRVLGMHASFSIGYDFGTARFNDCVVLSAMSAGGDSGSIITDMNMDAVALLFAGSNKVTIANPMSIVQQQYGLELYSKPKPLQELTINSDGWAIRSASDANLTVENGVINIDSPTNLHCYYEHAINNLRSVSCVVNTGTGTGCTWGPGIVVQWPNGMLKVNLRSRTFGGYYNNNKNISIGQTKKNTNYSVRIIKTSNSWQCQIKEKTNWHTLIAVPLSVFPHSPISVRLGKTSKNGGNNNYRTKGQRVQCQIKNFKIN